LVGYSLPDYNRSIDLKIIKALRNLNQVIIQDIHADSIKTKLQNIFIENNMNIPILIPKEPNEFHV
jgi:hypothetical protein